MAASPTLLGKAQLLAWAARTTTIAPCEKYADLKDGLIYLALARELFPHDIDNAIIRLQRRGARDATKNWSLLTTCLRRRHIPTQLCHRQAVERGHTRHCFNLLVLFYFLVRLSRGDHFSVDFAQPVDPALAAFLQSPESVLAVERVTESVHGIGASAGNGGGASSAAAEEAEGEEEGDEGCEGNRPALTRLSSPPSVAYDSSHLASRSSAVSPSTSTHVESNAAEHPANRNSSHLANHGRPLPSLDPSIALPAHRNTSVRPAHHEAAVENTPAAVTSSTPSALLIENRLLREELQYVKAVGQLLVTQQRGAEAAAEMRAAAALDDALAQCELRHLHDVRQLEVTLTSAPSNGGRGKEGRSAEWAALSHRADVAEDTAAQLYHEFESRCCTYDSTLQQLQQVFCSISDITAAARPAAGHPSSSSSVGNSSSGGAAAYEEAVASAMLAQLDAVPPILRDAFAAQLRSLLLTVNSLRVTNERLRLNAPESEDEEKEGQGAADTASSQPTCPVRRAEGWQDDVPCLSLEAQDITSVCARAHHVCQSASLPVQQACRRLVHVVERLQDDLEVAQERAVSRQQRCYDAESHVATAEAVLQQMRRDEVAQRSRDASAIQASSHAQMSAMMRRSQDRLGKAEQTLQDSQQLDDRVAEVLLIAFSTPGTPDMRWASGRVVALLDAFMKQRRPQTALEEALEEQCQTMASLRTELRLRGEEHERTKASLAETVRHREQLEQRCRVLEAQLRTAEARLQEERQDARAYTGNLHRALLDKSVSSSTSPVLPPQTSKLPEALSMTPTTPSSAQKQRQGQAEEKRGKTEAAQTSSAHHVQHTQTFLKHSPGTLRSPTPSDSGSDMHRSQRRDNTDFVDDGNDDHDGHAADDRNTSHEEVVNYRRRRGQTFSSSSSSATLFSSSRQYPTAASSVSLVPPLPPPLPHAISLAGERTPRTPTPPRETPSHQYKSGSASSSLLLSAAELERRKQEILRKYNVS